MSIPYTPAHRRRDPSLGDPEEYPPVHDPDAMRLWTERHLQQMAEAHPRCARINWGDQPERPPEGTEP